MLSGIRFYSDRPGKFIIIRKLSFYNDICIRTAAFDKLLKRIHPGAVVLLHSTSSTNAQILDELLTKWEEMGYHFAPLSELAEKI